MIITALSCQQTSATNIKELYLNLDQYN